MPDVKSVLQAEIIRLARKEVRSSTNSLQKKVKELKEDNRVQKRKIASLESVVARVKEKVAPDKIPAASQETLAKSRLSPKLIAILRKKLGLSRNDFAQLVGASPNAIYQWETGKATPRDKYKAIMVKLRGIGKREIKRLLKVNAAPDLKSPGSAPSTKAAGGKSKKKSAKSKTAGKKSAPKKKAAAKRKSPKSAPKADPKPATPQASPQPAQK